MQTLHQLLTRFKDDFVHSRKGEERSQWFIYTILAIIFPFASSKTSNLLRCLKTIFGFSYITKRRFYTFMASSKIPQAKLWKTIREGIPAAFTQERLLVALDDYLNPKSGKKIFGCHRFFDHAAKQNQSKYPWAQNVVSAGLLAKIKGRWACLPLSVRFYHPKKDTEKGNIRVGKDKVTFQTKLEEAAQMIIELYHAYKIPVLVVADSWFGNNGLWGPVHKQLGPCFHLISRLRCSSNLFDLPEIRKEKKRGRPKKYGSLLGKVSELAVQYQNQSQSYQVDLYGRLREVLAFDRVFMLKTLKCPVRVVWVYRKTQWVALFSTDLSLSVQQIIEYYGARWKIESGFKELKQDIGSLETQTRNPHAVINHLNFCMMAISLVWIHAMQLKKTTKRRHAVTGRSHFAFSDARRNLAGTIMSDNFSNICPNKGKTMINSIATSLLRMAA